MEFLRYGPTPDAAVKSLASDRDVVTAENRGLREEIVKAQSNSRAWMFVFESIEAHLRDRIAMKDDADPTSYLRIIQGEVENVQREGKAIANARWVDYARQQDEIKRLTRILHAILYHDERGQGTGYAEAMKEAVAAIGYGKAGQS